MKLLSRLLASLQLPLMPAAPFVAGEARPLARPRPPGAAAAPAAGDGALEADDAGPAGCGWFDSSHDLQQGLLVQEHLSPDSLAQELPLDAWLALHLAGWQPGRLQQPLS